MSKTVPTFFTILCLLFTVFLVGLSFNIPPVRASGTVYIRADGSVEGTTKIVTVDNVTYTLIGDINDSIVVERSNIIIDGTGHTVNGLVGELGFNLTNVNNVTIKNTQIKQSNYGVYISNSSGNTISGGNIIGNYYGVYLSESSSYNMISGNNITNNDYGVRLQSPLSFESSFNTISGNTITNNTVGVYLRCSINNTISGNNITSNKFGVYLSQAFI